MKRPTALLALLAVGHLAIGHFTYSYPPSYLTTPIVWGTLAGIAGLLCAFAIFDGRRLVALAGAAVAAHAFARAAAIFAEVTWRGVEAPQRASFTIAAITWAMFGFVSLALWRRLMVWGVFDAGSG